MPVKHQYFGDVNDYVKYGILRCFSRAGFSVGICWMLTPDDCRPDGRKIEYLSRPNEWQGHDRPLFEHLERTVTLSDGRDLGHIEGDDHIPKATFFSEIVPDSRNERVAWFKKMLDELGGVDLLFFDPDNGIEVPSKRMGQKNSSKYVYWQELKMAWKHASSLLVFQHFPRLKRETYIPARAAEMRSCLPGASVIPIRSSNVMFFLAHRLPNTDRILRAVHAIEKNWSPRVWRHCVEAAPTRIANKVTGS